MEENKKSEHDQPKEESLKDLLLFFIFTTKKGFIGAISTILLIFGFFFNPGIFGVSSFFIALLIAYAAYEYYHETRKPLHEGEKHDLILIKAILVPVLILAFFEIRFLSKQYAATELTREISGNPEAWAECQRFTPALISDSINAGYYEPSRDKDRAIIQYTYCKEWGNFYYSDKESIEDIQTLWSVGTVIHEAVHASGELNEAVTQCLTNKAFPNVLRKYGISEAKVKSYTDKYRKATGGMPSNYQNGKCDGHPLISRLPHIFEASPRL